MGSRVAVLSAVEVGPALFEVVVLRYPVACLTSGHFFAPLIVREEKKKKKPAFKRDFVSTFVFLEINACTSDWASLSTTALVRLAF
jgi:hypothetical protein